MGSRFNQDTLHQRTQLFGPNFDAPIERASSPYNNSSVDYSQSTLAQLESQSDAYVGIMRNKVNALRDLSMKMGEEIRGSNNTLDELGGTFERTKVKLKKTFIRMKMMAKRSKISIKTWLIIFTAVGLLFFYVWVF